MFVYILSLHFYRKQNKKKIKQKCKEFKGWSLLSVFFRYYYIVVCEADEKPDKNPDDYTYEELENESYESYVEDRENGIPTKPYIADVLTRETYKELNGIFIIGQEDQHQQQQSPRRRRNNAPTKYRNGKLFEDTQYFYFIRAYISIKEV